LDDQALFFISRLAPLENVPGWDISIAVNDDNILILLGTRQLISAVVAFVCGLISVRSWQGKVWLILLASVIYGIFFIPVGIH
jgi:hypothetical protein